MAVFEFLEGCHNPHRGHSEVEHPSLMEFERKHAVNGCVSGDQLSMKPGELQTVPEAESINAAKANLLRLLNWKYSASLFFAAANTLCSAVFQLAVLYKLGVGAQSDLYYASILIPTVLYSLAFGALNNILVPMFTEAKANGDSEDTILFWDCLLLTIVGGLFLLVLLYYPVLAAFPLMFHNLSGVDVVQVRNILLAYSLYQVLYVALLTKNCFLFARGRPTLAQTGVFWGWFVSLFMLWRLHPIQDLSQIPVCLVAGNAVGLLFPNLERGAFFYRKSFLKRHTSSLVSRALPVAAGTSVGWIEPLIDGAIASTMKQGSLTIYYFLGRIMFYTATALFSGYVQPITKHLAELAGEGRYQELRRQTKNVVTTAVLLSLGILGFGLLLLLYLSTINIPTLRPYVSEFGHNLPVFFLLCGYLFGTLGYAIYSSSLYVLRRERLFLIASMIVFPAGIGLKVFCAHMFGLKGLATGTSIYWITYAVVLACCFSWAVMQSERVS